MILLKCKKCGGNLNLEEDSRIVTCDYCGAVQTIPVIDDEKKLKLFARANRLRFNNEFDSAVGVYESIIADFPEEAEAYWGLILSKYGIEYVDDPLTKSKIPTCHRSSFTSVLDDDDFKLVMEYSDVLTRKYYREEAKQIEELRKSIIEISNEEEPYDVFICYKETDENGERTLDSVLGYDLYTTLTDAGYNVFFSRVSLEDKLGKEYEPYIFAALHSAKIMLVIGTDYEYFNAVWVKNEWSRFLAMIAAGEKKTLIPCYKNIDAYDMPREFQKLQAQNLGKIGANQDILHGINKILGSSSSVVRVDQNFTLDNNPAAASTIAPLLRRIELFIEDGQFEDANEFCERILNRDPENAQVYIYKFMAGNKIRMRDTIYLSNADLLADNDINKAYRFGDDETKNFIQKMRFDSLMEKIKNEENPKELERIKRDMDFLGTYPGIEKGISEATKKYNTVSQLIYENAVIDFNKAKTVSEYKRLEKVFDSIRNYSDASSYLDQCQQFTVSWRTILEKLIQNEEDYHTAQEIFNVIKSNLVFDESGEHADFVNKLDHTVLVEKYYGNKKQRILDEIKKYYAIGSL